MRDASRHARAVMPGDRITVEVPAALVHAIARLVDRYEGGFTGSLTVFFQAGIPKRRKIENTDDIDRP